MGTSRNRGGRRSGGGDKPKPRPRKRSRSRGRLVIAGIVVGWPLVEARFGEVRSRLIPARNTSRSGHQALRDIAREAVSIGRQPAPAAHVRTQRAPASKRRHGQGPHSRPESHSPASERSPSTPASVSASCSWRLLIVGTLGYIAIARELPEPGTPPAGRDQTSVIYDRNGEVLDRAVCRAEPHRPSHRRDPHRTPTGRHRHRGQALLRPQGRRLLGHRPRTVGRHHPGQAPRRLDHHPAVRRRTRS